MKKAQLLENMVRHPDQIYANATAEAGHYSKYPHRFRVVGLSYDGTQAKIQGVRVTHTEYLTNEDGSYQTGEDGYIVSDPRPVRERTTVTVGDKIHIVPFRLIAECDTPTEKQLVDAYIAREEERLAEREQYRQRQEIADTKRDALFTALADAVNYDNDNRPFYGDVNLALTWEQVDALTAILSNARQMEGV
jgi:hypothetical protein